MEFRRTAGDERGDRWVGARGNGECARSDSRARQRVPPLTQRWVA